MDWHATASVALGYFVLGLSGFGSALIMVPLLAWHQPLAVVVPLVLTLDLPMSAWTTWLNRQSARWDELWRLLPGMLLGMALGVWLASHSHSRWPLVVLGVYVMVIGVRALHRTLSPARPQPMLSARWATLYGLGVGLVEGLFATAGPVVAAWLTRRFDDTAQLRASIPMVMTVAALMAMVGMGVEGRYDDGQILRQASTLLLPGLLAVWLGHRLSHRVPEARMRLLIHILLVASGAMLLWRA